jgi:hypothetical protein
MRGLLALTCCLLSAASLFGGTIRLDRMDTYDTGNRLANGRWEVASGTKMTYFDFWGNQAPTTWQTWHWINNEATGAILATTGQVERTASSWSSEIGGYADFDSCYRGKATSVAGDQSQEAAGGMVCTSPNTYIPPRPPCAGCTADGTPPPEYVGTPLVVNTEQGPWRLTGLDDPVLFDIDADGSPDRMAWTARDSSLAFVARDSDGNGRIDSGSELFGDHARLPNGDVAANGFLALQAYDQNGDAVIDAHDALWSSLLLWTDSNHDGASQPGELRTIASSTIRGLSTGYQRNGRTDAYGNEFRLKSHVIKDHGKEPYFDIYFNLSR